MRSSIDKVPRVPIETVADRVRVRLLEQMRKQKVSQRDLSGLLGGTRAGWSHGRVAKILTGRTDLKVDDLAAICFVLDFSIVEALRDRGLEFMAEMTPSELDVLTLMRERNAVDSILYLMGGKRAEKRGVTKSREGRINKMR